MVGEYEVSGVKNSCESVRVISPGTFACAGYATKASAKGRYVCQSRVVTHYMSELYPFPLHLWSAWPWGASYLDPSTAGNDYMSDST